MEKANFPDDKIFNTIHSYTHLLAGAHRRRVVPLGSPALTRHLAFWNPRAGGPTETPANGAGDSGGSSGSDGEGASTKPPEKREALADAALADLYRMLLERQKNPEPTPAVSSLSTNCDFDEDGQRLVFLFGSVIDRETGQQAPWPKRIPQDSYRTIKFEFLWHGLLTTLSFELHTEFLALTVVVDASALKSEQELEADRERYKAVFVTTEAKLRELPLRMGAGRGECEELYKYYYYDFWELFSAEVLAPLGVHNDTLGDKFVDFRGLIVGARGESGQEAIGLPFSRPTEPDGTGGERPSNCKVANFDKLWNFITCTQHRDTEFTVSRFLGTRAFYATALGIQSRAMLDGTGKPLCYVMYEDTINPWQLGRVIYRVHRAGHARIAAIMHFSALLDANDLLNAMEGELESANALLYREPDDAVVTDEEYRDSLSRRYLAVEAKIGEIAGLKLDGTLESRIERSRYYVRQFAAATAALRIRRVSGFQRYDEFVSQRMGPVFEYIDSLGRKYARVQNDRKILLGRIQAYDSQRNQYIVSRAQTIADLALSCVLVPYYGAYVVTNAFAPPLNPRLVWLAAFCFGVITFVMAHLLKPLWEQVTGRQAPDIFRRLAFRYIVAFLAAVLIANLLVAAVPMLRGEPASPAAPHPGPHATPQAPGSSALGKPPQAAS